MNVLVLGGGGREHALAWKLRQSAQVKQLWALPGSDGIASIAPPAPGNPSQPAEVLDAVRRWAIDLTVIGPEAPLAAGVADVLRDAGYAVLGPSQAAAQLETSKSFAKQFMRRHGIPTARFAVADSLAAAEAALQQFDFPVVLKADGLAAGKGVVIAPRLEDARQTLRALFSGELVGAAGSRVVLEEFLQGEELSLLALCDGERAIPLVPAQDHKRVNDGDEGPNTGGMGAYSMDTLLSPALRETIESKILAPTLAGMAAEGRPFRGVLYCGLMLTAGGPSVLEYNVRFGDPETQAILPRFGGDLAEALALSASGALNAAALSWSAAPAACVVLASGGYPGSFRKEIPISGLDSASGQLEAPIEGVTVFHAGTRREGGRWLTAGGRVLGITAQAATLQQALDRCYAAAATIHFEGCHYRRDIGARALARERRA